MTAINGRQLTKREKRRFKRESQVLTEAIADRTRRSMGLSRASLRRSGKVPCLVQLRVLLVRSVLLTLVLVAVYYVFLSREAIIALFYNFF